MYNRPRLTFGSKVAILILLGMLSTCWDNCTFRKVVRCRHDLEMWGYKKLHTYSDDELIKLHERAKKKEEIEQSRTCFYDKLTLIYPEEVLDSVYQAIQLERDGYVYRQMSFLASEKDMREIYERLFKESNAHWSNWVKQVPGMERVSSFINNK